MIDGYVVGRRNEEDCLFCYVVILVVVIKGISFWFGLIVVNLGIVSY